MAWADVTAEDVLKAISQFDRLGRREFLGKYGFRPAKEYYVLHDGQYYDSKPIWAVAYGNRFGIPLVWNEFKGRSGKGGVESRLTQLGFRVVRRRQVSL